MFNLNPIFRSIALKLKPLTRRELQILVLIVMGYTSEQIGEILFISPETVGKHRTNIYARILCHDIADVISFMVLNNICEMSDISMARGTVTI